MHITIYNNASDPRVMYKDLTTVGTLSSVELTDQTSVENPSFILDRNDLYIGANYVYCQEFGRYYFINGIEIINGNQMVISCHVDVRSSFKNNILNSYIVADRSSSNADAYVPDSMVTVRDSIKTYIRKMPSTPFVGPSGSNNYVLTIGGR